MGEGGASEALVSDAGMGRVAGVGFGSRSGTVGQRRVRGRREKHRREQVEMD